MTEPENKKEQPLFIDVSHEKLVPRTQFSGELIYEFTNLVTAVIGYSELALHAVEESHPAREWLEKIRKHTNALGALLHKLIVLKQSKREEKP